MLAVVVVVAMLTLIVVIGLRTGRIGRKEHPTEFLDASADTCGICFGDLDGKVKICGCGKRFHEECAEPTGTCPYCNTSYSDFTDLKEERTRCPGCGRYNSGSVCRCGAVISQNGNFRCSCGASIDKEGLQCTGCGRRYERR